ncbi:cytochrome P450 [Nocardiopsis nanhaiensis]
MNNARPVRLSDVHLAADLAEFHRWMHREHGPVVPVLLEEDITAWLVIGYRELHYVLSSPALFARSSTRWNGWDRLSPESPLQTVLAPIPNLLFAEGEDHRRRSQAVGGTLESIDPHELRGVITRFADRLVDGFCGDSRAELRAQYAGWLPSLVLGWMYGFDDEEIDVLAKAMSVLFDSSGAEVFEAYTELGGRFGTAISERRSRPRADMISRLVADPIGYTDDQLTAELIGILGGGDQPTTEWIGNALRLMLTDARFSASFSGARSSVRDALAEVLWEDSPSQIHAGRFAAVDLELAGRFVRKGDLVMLGYGAANRDPKVRGTGDDRMGANHGHLSFSHGKHACPHAAQGIAELIATTGVEVLLDRLPDIELAVPPEDLRWRPSPWARGVVSLPVTFTPVSPLGGF